MPIIKSHDVTLYGSTDTYNIVLVPLHDRHLTYLYKWNADSEVLYWTESGEDIVRSYDVKTVNTLYHGVSKNALCFLIKANDVAIGECWIQKMNMPEVYEMYPEEIDVRRIDMAIGEKEYWNKGIGSAFIPMLIDYAFYGEQVDVLHCVAEDYNHRSKRMWEKNNFTLVHTANNTQPNKSKYQRHYSLTQTDFIDSKRNKISTDDILYLPIEKLVPSKPYLSEGKLSLAMKWFNPNDLSNMDPIPIKKVQDNYLMKDGHTRAYLAYVNGYKKVPCYLDSNDLDMRAYDIYVKWCKKEDVNRVSDLAQRIVEHKYYELLWRRRRMEICRMLAEV